MSLLGAATDFESEDPFLHALLGLLAAGDEVRAFADAAIAEAPDEQSPPVDDALLHALLGALYLRKKVIEVAERWAVEEAPSTSLTPDDGAPFTGEILR